VLAPALAALLLAATPPPGAAAYAHAWRGDAQAARAALSLAPGALPDDGDGLLVLACVELEAGRLEVAARAADRLAAIEPTAGEGRVLRALVARRRQAPGEAMAEALVEAWKSAGRPDLSAGGPLARLPAAQPPGHWPPAPSAAALARLTPEEAFLLDGLDTPRRPISPEAVRLAQSGGWREARQARAAALAASPAPHAVALDLALLGQLPAGAARERIRLALARRLPGEGYLAIMGVAGPPMDRGPLVATEVAAVERAAAAPRLAPPRGPLHEALLRAAAKLDPALAPAFAREALPTVAPPPAPLTALAGRAAATVDPPLRARAAAALERAAATLGRDPGLDARQLGAILGRTAAELRGDPAAGQARLERFEAWRARLVAAEAALGEARWPLPSLWRGWRPDREAARAERLAGPVPEPSGVHPQSPP
jgi:hypothetical protein